MNFFNRLCLCDTLWMERGKAAWCFCFFLFFWGFWLFFWGVRAEREREREREREILRRGGGGRGGGIFSLQT